MTVYKNFEDMPMWQLAKDIAVHIYKLTNRVVWAKDYGVKDQIRRASISVSSNIAEGFERGTSKEFVQYLNISRASAGEVRSQLTVARELEYVSNKEVLALSDQLTSLAKQITAMIQTLKRKRS